jgi:hypothetical protein
VSPGAVLLFGVEEGAKLSVTVTVVMPAAVVVTNGTGYHTQAVQQHIKMCSCMKGIAAAARQQGLCDQVLVHSFSVHPPMQQLPADISLSTPSRQQQRHSQPRLLHGFTVS